MESIKFFAGMVVHMERERSYKEGGMHPYLRKNTVQ